MTTYASSLTLITETSEVSLNSDTQVLASTGNTRLTACGRTTFAHHLPPAHAQRQRRLSLALSNRSDPCSECFRIISRTRSD